MDDGDVCTIDVRGHRVTLTRYGRQHWKGQCPLHPKLPPPTDPTCALYLFPDGHWLCFQCGAQGIAKPEVPHER